MGRFKHDGCDHAEVMGFFPSAEAEAPVVACLESGEIVFGTGRDQVVTAIARELEELVCHDRAEGVHSPIFPDQVAMAVAHEPRLRIKRTGGEIATENVFCHGQS